MTSTIALMAAAYDMRNVIATGTAARLGASCLVGAGVSVDGLRRWFRRTAVHATRRRAAWLHVSLGHAARRGVEVDHQPRSRPFRGLHGEDIAAWLQHSS